MKKFALAFVLFATVACADGLVPVYPVYPVYPVVPVAPVTPVYPVYPVYPAPVVPIAPPVVVTPAPQCRTVAVPVQTWRQVWTLLQGWVWKLETVWQYQVICRY